VSLLAGYLQARLPLLDSLFPNKDLKEKFDGEQISIQSKVSQFLILLFCPQNIPTFVITLLSGFCSHSVAANVARL